MASLKQMSIESGFMGDQILKHIVKNYSGKEFSLKDLKNDPIISGVSEKPKKKDSKDRSSTKQGKLSRQEKANTPVDTDKCQCRVWNHGYGGQCARKMVDGDFCKMHSDESKRVCGIITEPRPEDLMIHGKLHIWNDKKVSKEKQVKKEKVSKTEKVIVEDKPKKSKKKKSKKSKEVVQDTPLSKDALEEDKTDYKEDIEVAKDTSMEELSSGGQSEEELETIEQVEETPVEEEVKEEVGAGVGLVEVQEEEKEEEEEEEEEEE